MALTKSALDTLLACLDSDRDVAGEKYENLRRKLAKHFEWNNCEYPEDCADETLNRVARKLTGGEKIRDITHYCYGVARLIILEKLKERERRQKAFDEMARAASVQAEAEEKERRLQCMEQCLRMLPYENFTLIVSYYQPESKKEPGDKLGERLAEEMGLPLNALRIRAHRIRASLKECLKNCLDRRPGK